jgi:Na+/H+-translocating membrane pyrophosphatase
MTDVFRLKRSDRKPSIEDTLVFTGELTGATVKFIMRNRDTGSVVVNAAAVVVDAVARKVRYDWGASDTTTAGEYEAEWEVTHSGGLKESFPKDHEIRITIRADIA